MDIKILAGIVLSALIAGVAIVALSGSNGTSGSLINSTGSAHTAGSSVASQVAANASKVLFAGTTYAAYSYVVYPGPVSQQAQAALTGFNLTATTLHNASTEINLMLVGTGQHQSLVLRPGYKLYIIETTFGDDGYNFDSSLGDDGFVIVDQNGYVAA